MITIHSRRGVPLYTGGSSTYEAVRQALRAGVSLTGACLRRANLTGADLRDAIEAWLEQRGRDAIIA